MGKMSQTKSDSFFESLSSASVAAPTAMGLHKLLLYIFDDCANIGSHCNDGFVLISWIMFFMHSIAWKYVVRRIYDKYGVSLDPLKQIKKLSGKLK